MDSIEKLDETDSPSQEAFYSKQKNSGMSDEDYEHAKEVWIVFVRVENALMYSDTGSGNAVWSSYEQTIRGSTGNNNWEWCC